MLTDAQWRTLSDALNELGRRCKQRGMTLAFHNHAGSYIETPVGVNKLMGYTDPDLVGLCLDTGHFTYGGGDAAGAVQAYLPRLRYLHLKDLDAAVLESLIRDEADIYEGLKRRVFTELGKGCVDVEAIARILVDANWSGWVVSEQDTSHQDPLESAKQSRQALVSAFSSVPVRA